jgi:anti-sigma-K factor RskA
MHCISNNTKGLESIMDYCAGALDPAQAAAIEEHLRECGPCREIVEAQRSLWQTLDAWKPIEVSPDFDARLHARILQEQSAPWWRALTYWKPALSVAVVAGVLALIVVVRTPDPKPPAPARQQINIQEVQQALDDLNLLSPAASPL